MFDYLAGYPGVFFAAFLENFFPPLPSELIFPFFGFVAGTGKLDLSLVILSGTLGALTGSLFWYGLGYLFGRSNVKELVGRYGGFLQIHLDDVEKAEAWFARWQQPAVFLGRLVPLVRTLVSVPAGFARMPLGWFLLLSAAGTFLWVGALTVGGYLLGERWRQVTAFVENYELVFAVLLLVGATVLFVRFYRRHRQNEGGRK